jgi:Voltage gated chloride channel/CBS domain
LPVLPNKLGTRFRLPPRVGLLRLSVFAVLVGCVAGLGAVFFRALIHNMAFLGVFSPSYDANQFTPPGPLGALVILVPVSGGLIVTFLVTKFAPEARGHGVPEVMDAVYYQEGVIRPVVAVVKSLASAISIGTGAAVGREGPIIQIGAALGSSLGQWVQMAPWQRLTLVAAGAGAGIAATFNRPIGGVMFGVELLMAELSARTFLPVALATDLIAPIIVAVALSIGVRRLLSRENIYTIKLVGRRHFVPSALHANLFLVRQAREVMERDFVLLPADAGLESFLRQPAHAGREKYLVVKRGDHILGVLRVNTALRQGFDDVHKGVPLGEIVRRNFTIAREDDVVFDILNRMTRRGASMAIVTKARRRARASDIVGVISKEHIADSVAESIRPYGD